MMNDTSVIAVSNRLLDAKIAVGICGGIGAVEVVKIIRELRRHGAEIEPFMTPSSTHFITELSVEWAAAKSVVTSIGPKVEHLNDYAMLVVVPATLHTISKCALGICDNALTLLAATHFARRRPALFVPAMNAVLKDHPLYSKYCSQLREWGVSFLESKLEEEKMKVPAPSDVASQVIELWEANARERD